MFTRVMSLAVMVALTACELGSLSGDGGLEELLGDATIREPTQEEIDRAEEEARQRPICGEMTLAEVLTADVVSDECRDVLESWLPEPQNNAEDRVLVLGGAPDGQGGRVFYVQGLDAEGAAISAEAFAGAEFIGAGGPINSTEVGVVPAADVEGGLVSLSLVNDYSGSMRDEDLEIVEAIHLDLVRYLPPALEAEVVYFSEEVEIRQPFTEDEALLGESLALDPDYERVSTALLDGMGVALESLDDRAWPLRMMVVSTDGGENSSTLYQESRVLELIDNGDIFVIMLGALSADLTALKKLSGDQGVYFYARDYQRLKGDLEEFLKSFSEMVEVTVPEDVEALEVQL